MVHTFVIPELRVRAMAVPGHVDSFVVTPSLWEGERHDFDFHCGEYCGTGHAAMRGVIQVVSPAEHERSRAVCQLDSCAGVREGPERDACHGERLYAGFGCRACHSTRPGEDWPGPSLAGLWGSMQPLDNGSEIRVDVAYVRTSIREPSLHVVRGYGSIQMPPFRISDADVARLAYMRTLPAAAPESAPPQPERGSASRRRAPRDVRR